MTRIAKDKSSIFDQIFVCVAGAGSWMLGALRVMILRRIADSFLLEVVCEFTSDRVCWYFCVFV